MGGHQRAPTRGATTTVRVRVAAGSALHVEQLDLEDQRRVGRDDAAGATRAVAELWRDDERALAADLHRGDPFVPAGDDLMLAERKLERLPAIERAVELQVIARSEEHTSEL